MIREITKDCFQPRNKPRLRIVGKEMNAPNCVRAYRASPEDMILQLRLETRFVTVSLSWEEAVAFSGLIDAAIKGN